MDTNVDYTTLRNTNLSPAETSFSCITNGFQQLALTEKPSTSKKRIRRRPRQKPKNIKSMVVNNIVPEEHSCESSKTDLVDVTKQTLNFKITPVCSQNYGRAFRIKNLGCKHIHKSFYLNQEVAYGHQSTSKAYDEFPRKSVLSSAVANQNGIVSNKTGCRADKSNFQSNTSVPSASIRKSAKKSTKVKRYPPYWTDLDVATGLSNGLLIKGIIRINQKNYLEAYVSDADQSLHDYFLPSMVDRNRALEGDLVAIKLKPRDEWTEKHKTASVVYIMQEVHPRTAVGYLLPMLAKKKNYITFIPRDKRVPRVNILVSSCPEACLKQTKNSDVLYKVKITSWPEIGIAEGVITDILGIAGDLDSELVAILAEHNVETEKLPQEYVNQSEIADTIPPSELLNRLDLRNECIFTIDPATARDLDDAVSCKELPNGNLKVGVHISDVAFHVIDGTPLDKAVRKKATSVYFVNNVFHMLPEELCRKCSLLPGQDKRAFSVVWEMKPTGEIVHEQFVRSIINSCTQLSYEHAQMMIEDPNRSFEPQELPEIHGGFTYNDLSSTVNILNKIAVGMRQERFIKGALRIDQTKLLFKLNHETGEPMELFTYENKDSHRLIEEFMLLANMRVAQKIADDFPNLAFLRCHDPPKESMLVEMQKNLRVCGVHIDISSSKALQSSIWAAHDQLGVPQMAALNHLLAKPMNRARYFCAATQKTDGGFNHYALHVPIYTHFTSPIRRYADIMVHRLLAGSLGYTPKPKWSVDMVTSIAENCNRQKYSAKQAGDGSSDLFLAHYVEKHQPFVKTAVIFQVRNHSFDVLVNATGSIIRIHEKSFEKGVWHLQLNDDHCSVRIVFPETANYCEEIIKIDLFETITVNLTRKPNTNLLEAQLLRPITSKLIENSALQ